MPREHLPIEPLITTDGAMSVAELLDALDAGRRVVVRTKFLGDEYEVTLRRDGNDFYCDTPTRLHKHESREEMRACIENQGYASN